MVVKLYISGISGNKEVKKKQQRVQMILDSKSISYEAIDITEPGKEKDKAFMQQNGKVRESLGKHPLPPQIFNDEDFCGDYEDFDLANEIDELEKFLHIETSTKSVENGSKSKTVQPEEERALLETLNKKPKHIIKPSPPYHYHTYTIKLDDVNGTREVIVDSGKPDGVNETSETTEKTEVNGVLDETAESPRDTNNDNTKAEAEEAEAPVNEVEAEKTNEEVLSKDNEDESPQPEEAEVEQTE